MRLADFIERDIDGILTEWEAFAATLLPAAGGMASPALRDHAPAILDAVVEDIRNRGTCLDDADAASSPAPAARAVKTAAQTHAVLRARGGFDINQIVAEYRALRLGVLRRWLQGTPVDASTVDEILRFDQAIDHAVAESVSQFHAQVEHSRDLLLGMLGHDMRSPLGTILMTGAYLSRLDAGDEVAVAAVRLRRSAVSLRALIDDLMTFSRTSLGLGVNLVPREMDLFAAVNDEVDQLRGAHPDRQIALASAGDTCGVWDGARLQQLVRNLVCNAIQYGSPGTRIEVALRGDGAHVVLQVANTGHDDGEPLDAAAFSKLFGPLERGTAACGCGDGRDSLGLGLFIVREVARAHGGDVAVQADAGVTTFTVRLPRRAAGAGTG